MNPTPTYDLTTPAGLANAITDYAKQNPIKAAGMLGLVAVNPLILVGAFAGKALSKAGANLFKHPEKVIKAQRKTAVDIIKAGKENGVKKMKVTLDQNAGVDIGTELNGIPLKFAVGSDNKMTIEVEY